MGKYKIGITEAGDAGLDLSWVKRIDTLDGAVLITKNLTPQFQQYAIQNAQKVIVHATCTGYGGTVLEPNVPNPEEQLSAAAALVEQGFPVDHMVIRVDPIIPTEKGLFRALDVMEKAMDLGFSRFRISIIDMYPHVRTRFEKAGLPLPYGKAGMYPSSEQVKSVDGMLLEAEEYWSNLGKSSSELRIESCAEPNLKETIPCGCISALDLSILGLDADDADSTGYQRPACMCYSGKQELLKCKHQCKHQCLYCYWKGE